MDVPERCAQLDAALRVARRYVSMGDPSGHDLATVDAALWPQGEPSTIRGAVDPEMPRVFLRDIEQDPGCWECRVFFPGDEVTIEPGTWQEYIPAPAEGTVEPERCIDCDKPLPACSCEGVLRCSCGIPAEVCICAGDTEPSTRTGTVSPSVRLALAEIEKAQLRGDLPAWVVRDLRGLSR